MALWVLLLAMGIAQAAAQNGTNTTFDCRADALTQHNLLRAYHQAPALKWNTTMAAAAQAWATKSANESDCYLGSEDGISDMELTFNINLDLQGMSPCTYATLSAYSRGVNWKFVTDSQTPIADNSLYIQEGDGVGVVHDQTAQYNLHVLLLFTALDDTMQVFEFLTIVWASTTQLGCGAAQGASGCWSVVCRYSPPFVSTGDTTVPRAARERAVLQNVLPPTDYHSETLDTCNMDILGVYNNHRAEYQSPPMKWGFMLAKGAQLWAQALASQGCPYHSTDFRPGEVWTTLPSEASESCAHSAETAYREVVQYKFTNTPWTDNQDTEFITSFLYMVYKNITGIGCGSAQGPGGCTALVCWFGDPIDYKPVRLDANLFKNVGLPVAVQDSSQLQCQQSALTTLNTYRADHSVPSLTGNASWAALATTLAQSAANDTCNLSLLVTDKTGVIGFNISFSNDATVCTTAADYFYKTNNTAYKFTSTPLSDSQDTYEQWHYFTQVVWKNSSQVGCGSAQGRNGCWVVICKFDPPGNVLSDSDYIINVLPSKDTAATSQGPGAATPSSFFAPFSSTSSSSGKKSKTTGIVVGSCVAAGVLVAAIAGFLFWRHQRSQQQKQRKQADNGIWGKPFKPATSLLEDNTGTGYTGSSGQLDTNNMQAAGPVSGKGAVMEIQGLKTGELFTRTTAFDYTWNSTYTLVQGVTRAVEAGVNDLQLDSMVQSSGGQVQDCPVVCLSKEQVMQQLQLLTTGLLGRGGAALVFKALWPSRFGPDALLAVKVLKDGYDCNPYVLESFAHEASVLASVRHPNVVKLYGYCLDPPNVCLIMELLPCSLKEVLYGKPDAAITTSELDMPSTISSGSLGNQLTSQVNAKKGIPLTMSQVLQVSTEIAAGLAYLHDQPEQGLGKPGTVALPVLSEATEAAADVEQPSGASQKIVHRDLKPANILINSQGQVKISDFGLARRHDSTTIETRHVGAGTVPYQAPEILSGARAGAYGIKATNRCDVYSMAMIFWELLSKRPPWKDMNEVGILSQVINGKRPELPAPDKALSTGNASLDLTQLPASLTALPAYNDIIRQCWAQRDWRRPTAAEAHRLLVELQQKYQATASASVQVCIAGDE